jgi:hypothetical protein
MGNIIGQEQTVNKKYNDQEIKQNIKMLFEKNKRNDVEISSTLHKTANISPTETQEHIGGVNVDEIKFQSSRNRYLRHNIEEYVENLQRQYGGLVEENALPEQQDESMNEFNKIKEYLLNENNRQQGGQDESDFANFSFSSSFSEKSNGNEKSFFHALIGGSKKNADTSSFATTTTLTADDSNTTTESESLPETELTESESSNVSSTFSETSDAKVPTDGKFSSTSYTTSQNDNTPYIVQSTESSIDTSISLNENNNMSNSESSELNIVPFYSTESSNKHPYVARRFK